MRRAMRGGEGKAREGDHRQGAPPAVFRCAWRGTRRMPIRWATLPQVPTQVWCRRTGNVGRRCLASTPSSVALRSMSRPVRNKGSGVAAFPAASVPTGSGQGWAGDDESRRGSVDPDDRVSAARAGSRDQGGEADAGPIGAVTPRPRGALPSAFRTGLGPEQSRAVAGEAVTASTARQSTMGRSDASIRFVGRPRSDGSGTDDVGIPAESQLHTELHSPARVP
jgi:hypothetical protein